MNFGCSITFEQRCRRHKTFAIGLQLLSGGGSGDFPVSCSWTGGGEEIHNRDYIKDDDGK